MNKEKLKVLSFNSKIKSIEKVNPMFSRVKIYVLYTGVNRNGSYLSKESVENALYSIYNIPIVGEYYEDKDNFGGHGGKLEISDEGIKYIVTTKPYGVVPESAEVYWEQVTEEDGQVHDYLVIDGAYLWTGRYSELETILEEEQYGQSMEIEVVEGDYVVREGHDVFDIKEFIFSAFCILGISKDSDPEGHVEPAFEGAKVVAYSLDKESFKQQFSQMMKELKYTLEVEEGGKNQMPENKDNKFSEDLENKDAQNTQDFDESEESTNNVEEQDIKEEIQEEEFNNENSEETIEESEESENEEKEDYQIKYESLKQEYETLEKKYQSLEDELISLREYKRNREEDDIRQKFSTKVSEEELNEIFAQHKDSTIEKIEEAIFALIGKKNFSYENKEEKTKQNKVSIVSPEVTDEDPYGGIL